MTGSATNSARNPMARVMSRMRRGWGSPTASCRFTVSPLHRGLEGIDDEEQREGREQHDERDGRGASVVELLELRDDEQRDDLRLERHVARDEHHRAVL